jgi:prepilin-type processing-associated H-X9-DG protein
LIILILAALLFPVFARAREKARSTHCVNNLKQIGLALNQYLADYDEQPLATYNGELPYTQATPWVPILLPYGLGPEMFRCPSDRTGPISYAYNKYLLSGLRICFDDLLPFYDGQAEDIWKVVGAGYNWTSNIVPIRYPHKTIAVTDYAANTGLFYPGGNTNAGANGRIDPGEIPSSIIAWLEPPITTRASSLRHNGRANYLFLDGHVVSLRPQQIKLDTTDGDGDNIYGGADPCWAGGAAAWVVYLMDTTGALYFNLANGYPRNGEGNWGDGTGDLGEVVTGGGGAATDPWVAGPSPAGTHPTFDNWH